MEFEWDPAKDRTNREKHRIGFDEARHIFDGPVLTAPDTRKDYGEPWEITIGALEGVVVIVVAHTRRDGKTRLISARPANRKERKAYYDYLEKALARDPGDPG